MQTGHLDLGESELCDRLVHRGRILKHPDHYVWGCSPIYDPDGRVHVFYSRWSKESGWKGYILDSEIAHAVADSPEGPYEHADEPVVLDGRPGDSAWDSYSIHNPEVHRVGDRYALLYYGSSVYNRNEILGKIGLAFADSLDGPWERNSENPVVERGERGDWDSVAVNTPSLLQHPDGRFYIYYRAWAGRDGNVRNDKIGLAVADDLEGPYTKHPDSPVIDPTRIELSSVTPAAARQVGLEAPCAFLADGEVHVLARDFGLSGGRADEPGKGLLFRSTDGVEFSHEPEIAYHEAEHYYDLTEEERRPRRYGRFERPKLLFDDGELTHLFNAIVGGDHSLSTGHVFEITD
jgi:hypothetical protein